MTPPLFFHRRPRLTRPSLVAALSGWPNAGEAATSAVRYLVRTLRARRLAEIVPDSFYDFTSLRPTTNITDGVLRELKWPQNTFYYAQRQPEAADLILFLGAEPHLHWGLYLSEMTRVAREFGVSRLYALGSMYDRIPHTRETRVSGLVTEESLLPLLGERGLLGTSYQGPSSIHTAMLTAFARQGIPGVSLWAHASFYVQVVANPKATLALLNRLLPLLGYSLDLGNLDLAAQYFDETLDRLVRDNASLQRLVQGLEAEYDNVARPHEASEEDTEQIIRDVEEYLKGQQRGEAAEGD